MSKPERWTVGFRSAKYTDDPHEVYPVVSVPGGDWRPGTDHEYVRSGEQEQDARLMASAPDLLAALESIKDLAGGDWSDEYRSESMADAMADIARTAIAKATSDTHIVDYSHLEGGAK